MQEFLFIFIEQGAQVEKNTIVGTCYLKSQAISLKLVGRHQGIHQSLDSSFVVAHCALFLTLFGTRLT